MVVSASSLGPFEVNPIFLHIMSATEASHVPGMIGEAVP